MPIYEYRCNTCGATFEVLTRLSEANSAPICPECASPDTQKKLSTFASASGSTARGASSYSGSSCGSGGRFS